MRRFGIPQVVVAITILGTLPCHSLAQPAHVSVRPPASNVLVPQSRAVAFALDRQGSVRIAQVDVAIDIVETTATTTSLGQPSTKPRSSFLRPWRC